eukprot:12052774-Ditylum_brightwellii.AAC.1
MGVTWSILNVCYTLLYTLGFAQGCPLSSVLATLILGELLKTLNALQKEHAEFHHSLHNLSTNSTTNEIIEFLAYIDNASIVLPVVDIKWMLDKISEIGEPYGAILNKEKPRSLQETSTAPSSPTYPPISAASSTMPSLHTLMEKRLR